MAYIIERDEVFRVVCMIATTISTGEVSIGTGSFISKEGRVYLLTAEHVSRDTNDNTMLIMQNDDGNSIIVKLCELNQSLKWNQHTVADIAICELDISYNVELFRNRCFPYEHIQIDDKIISRDIELTAIGFPKGLGVKGKFSPLTFRSYPSSSFLQMPRADVNNKESDFFCLENPSVGGYSGGPLMDMGYIKSPMIFQQYGETTIKGIIHGTILDNSGGKIAMITPTYYLKDLM